MRGQNDSGKGINWWVGLWNDAMEKNKCLVRREMCLVSVWNGGTCLVE